MEKKEYLKQPFKPKENESVKRSEPSGSKIVSENRSRRLEPEFPGPLINKSRISSELLYVRVDTSFDVSGAMRPKIKLWASSLLTF